MLEKDKLLYILSDLLSRSCIITKGVLDAAEWLKREERRDSNKALSDWLNGHI